MTLVAATTANPFPLPVSTANKSWDWDAPEKRYRTAVIRNDPRASSFDSSATGGEVNGIECPAEIDTMTAISSFV